MAINHRYILDIYAINATTTEAKEKMSAYIESLEF